MSMKPVFNVITSSSLEHAAGSFRNWAEYQRAFQCSLVTGTVHLMIAGCQFRKVIITCVGSHSLFLWYFCIPQRFRGSKIQTVWLPSRTGKVLFCPFHILRLLHCLFEIKEQSQGRIMLLYQRCDLLSNIWSSLSEIGTVVKLSSRVTEAIKGFCPIPQTQP